MTHHDVAAQGTVPSPNLDPFVNKSVFLLQEHAKNLETYYIRNGMNETEAKSHVVGIVRAAMGVN